MADKQYYITIPGNSKIATWDEERYERNKEQLFKDHPDAKVATMSPINPDDEINDTDSFQLSVNGVPASSGLWSGEKLKRNSAQLLQDHPDVQINRVQPVNYWGDKLTDTYNRIEALNKEYEGLPADDDIPKTPRLTDAASIQKMNEQVNTPERKRKREIKSELEKLYAERENNPVYKEYWKQVNASLDDDYDHINDALKQLKADNPEAERNYNYARYTGSGMGSGVVNPYVGKTDKDYNSARESLVAARLMLDDAKKSASAPTRYGDKTGFWQAVADNAPDAISIARLTKAGLNMHLIDAIKKIQDKAGKDANIMQMAESGAVDNLDYLNVGEKELLKAFAKRAEVEGAQSEKIGNETRSRISRRYQAGQSTAQSLGFMADFLMYGGFGEAVAEKAVGGLVEGAARGTLKRLGAETLSGTIKAMAMTPVMPSSYAMLQDNMLRFTDKGGVDLSGKALAKAIGDVVIENVSETVGSKPLDLIGLPLNKVKFPNWAKALRNSPVAATMKQAGYNGFFEELVEEWTGNALRVATFVDTNALKDFSHWDQQLIIAGSFAPMALFSLPATAVQYGVAAKAQSTTKAQLLDIMDKTKMSDDDKAAALNMIDQLETPQELGQHMSQVYRQIVDNGGDPAQAYEAVMRHTLNASRYKVMVGAMAEQEDVKRSEDLVNLNTKMQGRQFWMERGEGRNKQQVVRRITDAEGNEAYVVGGDEQTLAVVYPDGTNKYVNISDLQQGVQDGTMTDTGEMAMNDYLDLDIKDKEQTTEQTRMQSERDTQLNEVLSQLVPQSQINVGTTEAPAMATVIQVTPDGVILQYEDGTSDQRSVEDVAALMGMPVTSKTDAELEQDEVSRVEYMNDIKAKADNIAKHGGRLTRDGQDYSVFAVFGWQDNEQNEPQLKVFVTDDQGENSEMLLSTDEVAEFIGTNEAAGVLDRIEPTKREVEERPHDMNHDFRGNPLPLKEDGSVDEAALWNNDPEAWARWNAERQNDGGEDSKAYINAAIAKLEQDAAALSTQRQTELDFTKRNAIDKQMTDIASRITTLRDVLDNYNQPATAANDFVTQHILDWQNKLGVKINSYSTIEEIPDERVRKELQSGRVHTAWYDPKSDSVNFYLPNIADTKMVDSAVLHEVVAHQGLRHLLGSEYNTLLGRVWNELMDDKAKQYYSNLVTRSASKQLSQEQTQRLAADEFIAYMAQDMDLSIEQSQTLWQRLCEFVKDILDRLNIGGDLTIDDLKELLQASMTNYVKQNSQQQQSVLDRIPTTTDKKGGTTYNWESAPDAATALAGLRELGYEDSLIRQFAKNRAEKLREEKKRLEKRNPATIEELKAVNDQLKENTRIHKFWNDVVALMNTEESQQEKRRKEVITTDTTGLPGITERFNAGKRLQGMSTTRTLAGGLNIKGHFEIVESGAVTPSHNPETFKPTEGYPTNENGSSINDRDYEHDEAAQQSVRQKAGVYDQRAYQEPVIVSRDGVVLSGNDRTMAGMLAADNGTDTQYVESLMQDAPMYGFTAEQVKQYAHPRLVFVLDEDMPYTTETMAMFNQSERKTQNKTEQMVKSGKAVKDTTFAKLADVVSRFDNTADMYRDQTASAELMKVLMADGVLNQQDIEQFMDNGLLSRAGQEYMESLIIGYLFNGRDTTVRRLMADGMGNVRRSIVGSLAALTANRTMGEYSLQDIMEDAIAICYEAHKGFGGNVGDYLRQRNLFESDNTESYLYLAKWFAIYLNSGSLEVRAVLDIYNRSYANSAGIEDVFGGRTAQDAIKEITAYIQNRYNDEIQGRTAENGNTADQRSQLEGSPENRTGNQTGAEGTEQGGPVRDSDAQNGTAVTPTDREWAAVKLIEAGADARLPELMSDEEIAEFTDEYEYWEQFNDELGQLYIDLDGDLKSTDKAIKTAAQRRIDTQQALVVRRFKPIEDMVRNLTAKYNLSEEDFIEQTQENPEDEIVTDKLEEAPKYEEGASEKEIQATKFTQDEWEQFVYGGSYITYKSERTGEILEPVMIDDSHFPIYGDHRVIVWRWKTSEYKDRTEATATADYIIKYLKANRFRATETKYVKNQYGFWTEGGHNGCSNPLFVRLPSVKKSQYSSSTYIQYYRDDDGLWDISGSADYEMGGGSLYMSRHLFNTKSDALRAAIVGLENFRKEHPGNHYNLKDVDNLIEHLKTKVLPLAMKDDGEIDVVPDTLAVQGELFTFDNRADKQPKKSKAKTKKETKKPAAKKAAPKKVVQADEGEDETEETNGRKVEPTETISFPDSENRIYLYEQGGKWESKVEVHADNGNMSGGQANPSNYPYNTREDAIRHALNYAQWYAKNIAGKTGIGHEGIDKFVDQVRLTQMESPAPQPAAPAYGSQNTIITADKYEELKRKMREKLNNLNAGFDPEVFFIGAQMAAFHVEAGARKFVDFAKRMIEDLGDAIRPYLKSIYNGARDLPGMEPYRDDMDSAADVDAIDVNAITLDEQAAETVEETQEEVTEEEETETETETEQQAEDELAVHEGDLVVLKKKPQGFDGALKVVGRNTDGTYNLEYNPTGFLPVTMMNVDADDFIPFVRHHREDISEQRREVEAQQPQESAPAAEQTTGRTVGEIGTYTHTKTGREMSIVRLTGDRLSADEFKELKARAKELGGYYSSYGGAKGFLFDNVEDATKFNNLEYETEQTDEQTATDTAAIVSQAASVAEQAQSIAQTEEPAEPERAAETITAIDEQLDKIDSQLALLGYYTADTSDRSKFHESYGYMKSAEEKARKDAEKLARKLAADLGIEVDKKRIAKTNVAPAGGDVTFRLPLKENRELYVNIEVTPTTVAEYNSYMRGEDYLPGYGDDLAVGVGPMGKNTAILYRVENTNGVGGFERYGSNNFAPYNVTYQDLLSGIRRVAREFLPEQVETPAAATAQSVDEKAEKPSKTGKSKKKEVNSQSSGDALMGDLFADIYHVEDEQEENEPAPQDAAVNAPVREVVTELNGYKIGDRVLYTDYTGKTQEATIYEFDGGRPVLDSGFAPVMYELVEWDNIKPIDNGLEGNDAVRTQGLPADNTRPAEGEGGSAASVPETDRQEAGGADRAGESGGQSGEQPGGSVRRIPRLSGQNKRNNHVSKGEAVYPKTPAARFKANIAAIRLLKELQTEGKQATKEQMAVLRQFTGWGGLGGYFNNSYSEENRELRSLLTGDEFDAAQLSINTAYYTPTEIIDTLWDVAAKLGFQGGKILEGSAGIGNILASIPKGMNEASQITAVELDNITGGILEQLYPDAQVYIRGFETVDIDNASVDLAITNVPFGENLKIYDAKEKDLTRLFGSKIHDFCIAKNIRKLRPGGVGIFISSRGTLDSSSRKLRQWIVNEGGCDVIGAFRLNNETFVGTGATADIIVVRKRVNNQVSPDAIDVTGTEVVRSEEYETGETEYNRKEHRFEPIIGRATMEMNTYFTQHPEYMGGEMAFGFEKGNTYRAGSAALYPSDKIDQAKRLKKWVSQMKEYQPMEVTPAAMTTTALEDTQGVKEGQLIVNSKGEICQSRRGKAVPVPGLNNNKVKGKYTKAQVLADYDALKAAIKETLDYQLKNESDEGLQPLLKKLNRVYDDFVKKYGYLTRNASISFLKNDVEYSATEQVEIYKEKKDMDGKVTADVKKAQLFYVRQLNAPVTPTPETVQDGVIVSMNQFGRINIPFIAQAMNLSEDKVREDILAAGVGFEDPASGEVVIEYEYLSGNVREKLEYANEHNTDGRYDNNIKALQNVIPADIPAHLIEFSLGSDWLPVSLYVGYAHEKFGVNDRFQPVKVGGSWTLKEDGIYYIDGRNEQNRSAGVTSNALNIIVYGHELMLAAMNNKTVEFVKTETVGGEKETRRDKEATAAATTKMNELRDDFKEWARQKMQSDEELAAQVSKIYNELFNSMVPKQIRDIYVPEHFNGMANVLANGKPLSLRPHQARAVIRSTTEPVILAHEVGTGKTFTLITAAMEMRRLGTAKKPMIVVQNATLGQFVASAKELYPSARILTISEQDRTVEGRGAFYAKIRYNDWDLIIVPQSVFEMMPDSEERRRAFIQSKIEEKEYILSQAEQSGDQNVRRRLQQEIDDLKYEYETGEKPTKGKKKDSKRQAESINNAKVKAQRQLDRRTDDVSNFDEMGIDALLIDEAHAYKHLGFATAMQRGVKGVDASGSKRAAGVFLKTRSIFDRVGWKNVVFATGTPISNTAAEIWTFMKYLLPDDFMWKNHIYYFDDFVRNFGSIQQNLEFTTSGKFKETTRFAAYTNLPELVRIWMTIADVVLTKEAVAGDGETLNDKVPRMEDWTDEKGERHENQVRDIYLPQSAALITIMAAVRAELERFENMSGKEKQENSHIPLVMFGTAKAAAIDTRLVSADSPDEPQSKTNRAVEETLKALEDSKRYKGTCALFCDTYRRWDYEGGRRVEGFNVFEEIRRKLIARGVPADQIIIMESGMSTAAKEKIFAKVNNGEIRVIMGTTATLGTGVNIQERLFFEAHLDAPNRPMDYTQRMGRILRQGNLHKEWGIPVRVIRFGVEDSLDVTAYQRLSTKSKFINSVMDSKHLLQNGMEDRVLEEEEEGEFDNPVAILSGSEYALLKTQAERELRKLQNKKEQHRQDQIYIENKLKKNNTQLGLAESNQAKYQQALDNTIKAFPDGIVKEIAIEGVKCKDDKAVAAAVKAKIQDPISAIIADLRRLHDEHHEEKHTYTMTFDGVKANVIVNLVSTYGYDFNKGEFNTKVSSQLQFECDECGFTEPVDMSGGYNAARGIVEYFKLHVANGSRMRHNLELLSEHIDRLKKDNELMLARKGKPFADEDKLKEQTKLVEDLTEKMKVELAAKEAKYAEELKKNPSSFVLHTELADEDINSDDDSTPSYQTVTGNATQILDYYENPDGIYSYMSEEGLVSAVEMSNVLMDDERVRDLVDEYRRLDAIDREEGRRDFTGGEMQDLVEFELVPLLREIAEQEQRNEESIVDANVNNEIFISNALKAVQGIKQEKATPQQWLAMIQKQGGLKAGEDKWLGLSQWLQEQTTKTLTKQEVIDYINENAIKVEETWYGEDIAVNTLYRKYPTFDKAFVIDMDEFHGTPYVGISNVAEALKLYNQAHPDDRIAVDEVSGELTDSEFNKIEDWGNDVLKNEIHAIDNTRAHYQTFGLENNREIALTVPTIKPYSVDSTHFGDADQGRAIAWARFGDAFDQNGKAVLFIDEIQSKRHQDGRKLGYNTPVPFLTAKIGEYRDTATGDKIANLTSPVTGQVIGHIYKTPEGKYWGDTQAGSQMTSERDTEQSVLEGLNAFGIEGGVPDAPFDKNWHELTMKRMLRLAAEEGYEKIAWTTGQQQAERYNIGGQLNSIRRMEHDTLHERQYALEMNNRGYQYITTDDEGNVLQSLVAEFQNRNLSDIVGKELAVRMLAMKENDTLEGDGLRVGGQGMVQFYDRMLPAFVNKYGKQWGVSVKDELVVLNDGAMLDAHVAEITPQMRYEMEQEPQVMFQTVTDPVTIAKLEAGDKIRVYRAMQEIDGKLYPPMAARVDGKMVEPVELGKWEQAVERPELADAYGRYKLDKGNGKSLKARYNPYIHTSRSPLNDQFTSAYDRPNLVTVEVEVPESELTSGYKAQNAKDSVGEIDWHSGPVSSKLPKEKSRKVILTRWDKPIRVVPDSEVAQKIAQLLEGEDIAIPYNTVTPSLRYELEQLGVKISGQPSGNVRGAKKVLTDNQVKMLSYVTGMSEDEIRTLNDEGAGLSAENGIFASNNRNNERGTDDIQRQAGRAASDDAGRRADAVRRSDNTETNAPGGQSVNDIVKPLRKLKPGETCLVERKLSEAGEFSFIGRDRIESTEDVAFIFRKLETKAVENSFIVFVKDGKPTVLHVGMGNIDAVNVDLSGLSVMMKEIKPDQVYFVHNHPSGNIISSAKDRKLWALMQTVLGKKLMPGIIIDTTRGVYGTYMDEFDTSMPENFTGREGDVKIPTYRFDEMVFSKDYEPVRGERVSTSRDVAAYVSSHRLGERDKISVLCINTNNIVVGNFFLPYTGMNDIKTINKIAVDCAYYAGITNARAVVVYGSGVDPRTDNRLDALAPRVIGSFLNAHGTTLLDMVGGKTVPEDNGLFNYYSYRDRGRIAEPGMEYGSNSDDDIRYQTVEPTDYEGSAADVTERCRAVGANLGVPVQVINEPFDGTISFYEGGTLTINIGTLNGRSELSAALMAMTQKMTLSEILGDEAVRSFAQECYRNLPEFRQKVVEIAQQQYGWNTAQAMMQYLSSMAESETADDEAVRAWNTIWVEFDNMLNRVFADKAPMGMQFISTNELRYILFQNAHHGDNSIATIARGAALAHRQGVSAADNENRAAGAQAAREQEVQEHTAESAANLYNRVVSRMWSRMDETYRDQFQSVNTLVDALEKASGKKAQGFEDIRKQLNQQSSKGLAAMQKWEREHWDKMMKTVQTIIDERGLSYDEIERYLMLKHGIERNDILARRDARAYYQAIHDAKVTQIMEFAKQHPDVSDEEIKKRISREDDKLDRHFVAIESGTDSKYKELREKDYGGLTGLYSKYENINPYDPTTETQEEYEKRLLAARKPMFDNMADTELAADAEIADFEKRMGSDLMTELWNQINGATKAVLKHQYDANMMSRGQYEHVRDMFKYYVPLRGFAETTPEDMYSYYTSNADATFVAPLKQAKGRKTRAESPLAYIGAMASSAIAADIKNESKLALYYFVSNRQKDNDLVLVSDVWYVKQVDEEGNALLDEQGRTIFEPQYPPFTEALSTDQAKAEYEQWENEMKQLAREHRAFRGVREIEKQRLNYVVNTTKQQVKSHIIAFKLGGRDMFMFINGNPRAAQAINGELNVDASKNEFTKATLKFLRAFASLNTSLNPEFWLSNLQRDTLFALMSVNIKEDKAYNEAFRKNLKQALKVVRMKRDLQQGKLGDSELEQHYRLFVENGGVTGYTSVRGTDVWEAEIKKYTGDTRTAIERAGAALDAVQEFGESFEQMTRFAAYLTSREQGKSVVESVADAKELTVNFNRKGSGKGITWKESEFLRTREGRKLNDIERLFAVSASMLSVYGRHAIMFFNASVQGLNAMYQLAKKDKSKLGLWVGGYLMLGAMNAVLHAMLDGDDDDDDQYLDVPDYERRNNLLLGLKGVYLKWALPQEARVFYGMGDMIINHSLGREPHRNIVGEVASMIGEIAPLDATSGLAAVLPSITTPVVEVIQNEDYKGARVYNDNRFLSDEEKKHIPAYREPLKNTSKVYLALSEALNWISGGNEYEAGAVNWNPNIMEHIVEGYTGGLGTTVGKGLKFMENALGGEVKISDTPFLRRLMTWNDDRYRNAHVTDLYYYYREVAQDTERRLKEAMKAGDEKYYKKVAGSYDYKVLEVWKRYEREMEAYDKDLRQLDAKDRKQRKQITREHDALRARMIRDISDLK